MNLNETLASYRKCMDEGITLLRVALAYAEDGAPHAAAEAASKAAATMIQGYRLRQDAINSCMETVNEPIALRVKTAQFINDAGDPVHEPDPPKQKRKMSAAGRKAISIAQKKRWAKYFKAK